MTTTNTKAPKARKLTPGDERELAESAAGLAESWLRKLLHGDNGGRWGSVGPSVVPAPTIQRRKRLFAVLVARGYAAAFDRDSYDATGRAWDEVVPETPDLTALWHYDRRYMKMGHGDYVVWDRLTLAQKKAVVLALQADPASYTLAYAPHQRDRGHKPAVAFRLGEGMAAREACGGWDGCLVVSSPALRAAARAAARADYKGECRQEGLNWYLRKLGAIDPSDGVVLVDKTPLFVEAGSLPRHPEQWPAAVPAALAAIDAELVKLARRKAVLLRVAAAAETAGGWDKFLAAYDAAVDGHVEENAADYLPAEAPATAPATGG